MSTLNKPSSQIHEIFPLRSWNCSYLINTHSFLDVAFFFAILWSVTGKNKLSYKKFLGKQHPFFGCTLSPVTFYYLWVMSFRMPNVLISISTKIPWITCTFACWMKKHLLNPNLGGLFRGSLCGGGGGRIILHLLLVRIMLKLKILYASTHPYLVSENIPFGTKNPLILLMSAFLLQKQYLYSKQ